MDTTAGKSPNLVEMQVHLLVQPDGVLLQRKDIVGKHHYFVIPSLVELNQELASSKFIRVHSVEKNALLCLDGDVFSVELG